MCGKHLKVINSVNKVAKEIQKMEKWLLPEELEKALEEGFDSILTEPWRLGDGIPSGTGCKGILDRGHIKSKGMKKENTPRLSGEEEFYPKIFKKSLR